MGVQSLNLPTARARQQRAQLDMLTRQNRARVECPHCRLLVAPWSIERHVALCRDEA